MSLIPSLAIAAVLAAGSGTGEPDRVRPGRDLFGTRKQKTEDESSGDEQKGPIWGEVMLSDGTSVAGWLTLSMGRSLEFYDIGAKKWLKVSLAELVHMDAAVRSEEFEKEWRWKEHGSDVKVYTGRGYPRRWLDHTIELRSGKKFTGHINGAVLHVKTRPPPAKDASRAEKDEETKAEKTGKAPAVMKERFILRQYERGPLGKTLDDLVYVKSVVIKPQKKSETKSDTKGEEQAETQGSEDANAK